MALIDDLKNSVTEIKIESAYLPPVTISDPFAGGEPNPILSALKPRITLTSTLSKNPIVLTPYGDPGNSKWPFIKIALILALAGGAAYYLTSK